MALGHSPSLARVLPMADLLTLLVSPLRVNKLTRDRRKFHQSSGKTQRKYLSTLNFSQSCQNYPIETYGKLRPNDPLSPNIPQGAEISAIGAEIGADRVIAHSRLPPMD